MFEMNFFADWTAIMRSELMLLGCNLSPSASQDEVGYSFFNVQRRRIEARSRCIAEAAGFQCPSEFLSAYTDICKRARVGGDLTPYQTENLARPTREDQLLNDWDVHHLHLGTSMKANGFVSRTDELLFVRVTSEVLYIIGIFKHRNWARQEIVKMLHDNWAESLSQFRLRGVTALETTFSDSEIAALRKVEITPPIQVADGTVYGWLGGGISAAGTSVQASVSSGQHFEMLEAMENWIRDNINEIRKEAELKCHILNPPYRFQFCVDDRQYYMYEKASQFRFQIPEVY